LVEVSDRVKVKLLEKVQMVIIVDQVVVCHQDKKVVKPLGSGDYPSSELTGLIEKDLKQST